MTAYLSTSLHTISIMARNLLNLPNELQTWVWRQV